MLPYLKYIEKYNPQADIYLVSLEKQEKKIKKQKVKEDLQKRQLKNTHPILLNYHSNKILFACSFIWQVCRLFTLILRKKIRVIHSWCLPPCLYALPLSYLTRTSLIIDSCEPHADSMVDAQTWNTSALRYKIMHFIEKKSIDRAEKLILCVNAMQDYISKILKVDISNKLVVTKPACVDLKQFQPLNPKSSLIQKFDLNQKIVMVYAGKLGGLYYEHEVFELLKAAQEHWKDRFVALLLTHYEKADQQFKKYALNSNQIYFNPVPYKEVVNHLNLADFALNPTRKVLGRRYGAPIKNAEYFACGLPIVIADSIADDSSIVKNENAGAIWNLNQPAIQTIQKIDAYLSKETKDARRARIREIAKTHKGFELADQAYQKIYS